MTGRIVILNGPNLNCLGRRETALYGTLSMEQVMLDIQRRYPDVFFTYYQSNHEGDLIDRLQEPLVESQKSKVESISGIVFNAGGYTHTSVALRDAVALCPVPVVEVHITDIAHREAFRKVSLLSDVCAHTIIGHGTDGYLEAVQWLLDKQSHKTNTLPEN
ncbi:MAG: 3-dehydroquinate dehydratase [Paludibacteraceae bacterium]|nr:3-dehydroquinate dehydratase [Paludibacteraceae bacterium]